MAEFEIVEFIDLINHPNYEILNTYPFTIRRKDNHYIIKETLECGYLILMLQDEDRRHKYLKHRLVAEQFIPNPNNLPEVDHINHERNDNHIENLRWVSKADNNRNKSIYAGKVQEYVDEIDEESIVVSHYGNHELENYYFHNDIFYFWNGIKYRKLPIIETPDGYKAVNVVTKTHKKIKVFYTKFKRDYNI